MVRFRDILDTGWVEYLQMVKGKLLDRKKL